MMRWRPDSIASTIALAIIIAMVLGAVLQHAISIGLLSAGLSPLEDRQDGGARPAIRLLPGKIAAVVDVVEATPATERPRIISAVTRPFLRIELLRAPVPDLVGQSNMRLQAIRGRIQAELGDQRPVIIVNRRHLVGNPALARYPAVEKGFFIEVRLSDGNWLLFTTTDHVARDFALARFGLSWALSVLLVGLLSVLAARRIAAPIADFATGAERLGSDSDAPPLAERGPREIRAATRAFNRMQERLRRFIDDRTQMLAAMSHDLRTPLTRLKLRAEFVEDAEEQRKMMAELDRMSAMIESTLIFARDDTQREPRALVDLGPLVESVCAEILDAGASVSFSGPRGIDLPCRPIAIRRAIANLVDNAVKYGGGARVSLAGEARKIVITIDDDGPGIPAAEQEKVFGPFYRLGRGRSPDTGGVGLGLAVARTIAREHGGDVRLVNRAGGGLRVYLELPA